MAESRLIIFDKGRRTAFDDAELVAALRAHDERAYTAAWIELGPMVRRLVTRFFGSGADTPDLSQEVFLRLFRRIDELRNPSGLRGFVVSICLGVARNELRRVRVRRWVMLTSTGDLPDAPVAGPDLEGREALRHLYAILDEVSVQDRSLFVARFFEKMEIAEVAAAHGLSYGTAKRHVARATSRINRRIERDPLLARYLDAAAERSSTPPRGVEVRGAAARTSGSDEPLEGIDIDMDDTGPEDLREGSWVGFDDSKEKT
ncbi:MAG: sigma-70 family RNA polymerase sigma factor [Deltaproteobacteria bacterium]|nr:sigma-70 family RNA polymerase sigma factor [Deltaproteobacteria bacterium]